MNNFFADHSAEEGHGRRSVRGGALSMFGRGVMGVAQIGSMLFLARLLSPEEYGLVAMVTALTGFAQILVDLGTRDAIVQRKHITAPEVSALFWINVLVGCGFALIIASAAPAIARFYGEPRLRTIALVSSTTFVLAALGSQHQALLRRAGMFRQLAIVETGATLLSIFTAVGMAYAGFSYWALTARPVSMFAFMSAGMWAYCRWVPGRAEFSKAVREMIQFGVNLVGFSMSDYAGRSGQRVAVGRGLGAQVLGYYQNALQIYDNMLDLLVASLHSVAVSGLSKLMGEPEEFRRSWAKALSTLAFFTMPIFGILSVTAQDVVVLLLGPKWAGTGLLLAVIALRGIPQCLVTTTGWLHVTAGRTDRFMRWGWFTTLVQLSVLVVALPFGTVGIAVAYSASMFVLCLPALSYAGYPLGIKANEIARVVWRQFAGAIACAAMGFALRFTVLAQSAPVTRVVVLMAIYLVFYFSIVAGLLKVRAPLRIVGNLLRDILPPRLSQLVPGGVQAS